MPVGQKVNTSVAFFNPEQVAPISYQYNFGIQREVARDLLLEAGYIGNVSHHLTANDLSLNQVPPQLMTSGNAQLVRPFPQFNNVTWINPSIGNSTYHGGFIRAGKADERRRCRSWRTTRFRSSWTTWKRRNEFGTTGSYMDAYNRRLDKGLQRQRRAAPPGGDAALRGPQFQGQSAGERACWAAGRSACWRRRNPVPRSR